MIHLSRSKIKNILQYYYCQCCIKYHKFDDTVYWSGQNTNKLTILMQWCTILCTLCSEWYKAIHFRFWLWRYAHRCCSDLFLKQEKYALFIITEWVNKSYLFHHPFSVSDSLPPDSLPLHLPHSCTSGNRKTGLIVFPSHNIIAQKYPVLSETM